MNKSLIYTYIIFSILGCRTIKMEEGKKINGFVFIKQTVIEDESQLRSSTNTMLKTLKSEVLSEREDDLVETDTVRLNTIIEQIISPILLQTLGNTSNVYDCWKIKDSLIISHREIDNRIIGDYTIINTNNNTTYKIAKKDTTVRYLFEPYVYNNSELIISEQRDSIKTINGFTCFKVSFKSVDDLNDYSPMTTETNYELYVTKDIKLRYHPHFRYKQILDKYYPVRIIESNSSIQGQKIIYEMNKF